MSHTQLLDWDSDILGVRVAKILSQSLDKKRLELCLLELKAQGTQLVYWVFASQNAIAQKAAEACGGFLVDEKITYCVDLTALPSLPAPCPNIEVYTSSADNPELTALALEIVPFSRFSQDPNIPKQRANALYTIWIKNACKQRVAQVVLVARIHHIVGMVVIDNKQGRADLSLLAVDPQYRGQGLGRRLVHTAQAWCLAHGYTTSQVVTQKINPNACCLYERCGYQQEKIDYFYHFWL